MPSTVTRVQSFSGPGAEDQVSVTLREVRGAVRSSPSAVRREGICFFGFLTVRSGEVPTRPRRWVPPRATRWLRVRGAVVDVQVWWWWW
jgi:hypothetical protein